MCSNGTWTVLNFKSLIIILIKYWPYQTGEVRYTAARNSQHPTGNQIQDDAFTQQKMTVVVVVVNVVAVVVLLETQQAVMA